MVKGHTEIPIKRVYDPPYDARKWLFYLCISPLIGDRSTNGSTIASAREPLMGSTSRLRVDYAVLDRLRAMRSPGESYSDVILRIVVQK
jgi:hypothetical protein